MWSLFFGVGMDFRIVAKPHLHITIFHIFSNILNISQVYKTYLCFSHVFKSASNTPKSTGHIKFTKGVYVVHISICLMCSGFCEMVYIIYIINKFPFYHLFQPHHDFRFALKRKNKRKKEK